MKTDKRRLLIITLLLFLFISCNSIPDINETNSYKSGPWLTLKSDPSTSITISWLTKNKVPTIVYLGDSPETLEEIIVDDKPAKLHNASFENLRPDFTYYYSLSKKIYSFKTASKDSNQDYKISIIGDLQPYKKLTRTTNAIMSESIKSANPDLVVQLGDVSENGGMDFLWRYTLKNISRYASQAPFMSAVGNHSYYWNGNYNFRKIFPYNYVSDKGLYYSMDYYNSHMIFLDLFDDEMKISEEQKDWAEADLSEAVNQGKKWIFIFLHDNVLGTGDGPPNWELQKWLVPLADKYNVDAVFFGHVHNYEHWLYTYGNSGLLYEKNQTPTGRPVHYFCSGGGGAALGYYYNLMEHEPRNISRIWYDTNLNEYRVINITDTKWDSEQYIDHMDNPRYGAPPDGKHYYQIPGNNSFSSSNELYGYQYGEQTLHYINIEVSGEKNSICEISVHYPNGDLLKGPNDNLPQSWVLTK